MNNVCERSACEAGWFRWFGMWLHIFPWDVMAERPAYIIGSARDLCLLQGLHTGDTTL